MLVLVGRVHRRQAEPVAVVTVERDAQVPGGVPHHEGHEFGGGFLRREDEVTLVLTVLVVDHDDRFTGGDIGDRALDAVEPGHLPGLQISYPDDSCFASTCRVHPTTT